MESGAGPAVDVSSSSFPALHNHVNRAGPWAEQTGAWPPGLRTPAFGFLEWARETAHQLDDNHAMTRDEFFGSFTTGFGVRAVKPGPERDA